MYHAMRRDIYRAARMGLNIDDYPDFQPKIIPAKTYATQCRYYVKKRNATSERVLPHCKRSAFLKRRQKFEKNLPLVLTLLSKNNCFVKTGGKFCGFLTMSELYQAVCEVVVFSY